MKETNGSRPLALSILEAKSRFQRHRIVDPDYISRGTARLSELAGELAELGHNPQLQREVALPLIQAFPDGPEAVIRTGVGRNIFPVENNGEVVISDRERERLLSPVEYMDAPGFLVRQDQTKGERGSFAGKPFPERWANQRVERFCRLVKGASTACWEEYNDRVKRFLTLFGASLVDADFVGAVKGMIREGGKHGDLTNPVLLIPAMEEAEARPLAGIAKRMHCPVVGMTINASRQMRRLVDSGVVREVLPDKLNSREMEDRVYLTGVDVTSVRFPDLIRSLKDGGRQPVFAAKNLLHHLGANDQRGLLSLLAEKVARVNGAPAVVISEPYAHIDTIRMVASVCHSVQAPYAFKDAADSYRLGRTAEGLKTVLRNQGVGGNINVALYPRNAPREVIPPQQVIARPGRREERVRSFPVSISTRK